MKLIDADKLIKQCKVRSNALTEEIYSAIARHDYVDVHEFSSRGAEVDSFVRMIKRLPSAEPQIVRCGECVYYDPPHIEDGTIRYEYKDMPNDAFDGLGTGLVHSGYGVNVGGRCLRSRLRLAIGKSIFMDEDDYCSRGERRASDE